MILYPTETTYGLGVNALDPEALETLYVLKGRDITKAVSWLVRNIEDIEEYGVMSPVARKIAEKFLPGPLTLVLPLQVSVQFGHDRERNAVGFRISSDAHAAALAERFMSEYGAPITATSANVSAMSPCEHVEDIIAQFGEKASMITEVIDDGPRCGMSSTVVRVEGDTIEIIREGAIPATDILALLD
jgi:L-threonylcarbamoyladenylate synthase